MRAAAVLVILAAVAAAPPLRAEPVPVEGYDGSIMEPFVSRDGRYLFWNSDDSDRQKDIYYAERLDDGRFLFRGPVQGVNTPHVDGTPSLGPDGTLYFISNRAYKPEAGEYRSVYRGRFEHGVVTGVELVPGNLASELTSPGWIMMGALISHDGNTLYLSKARFARRWFGLAITEADFSIAHRHGGEFRIDPGAGALLRRINTRQALEYAGTPSADRRLFYFTRTTRNWMGLPSKTLLMRAGRATLDAAFGEPVVLRELSDGFVEAPALSPDGKDLYYHKKDGKRFVLHRAALSAR